MIVDPWGRIMAEVEDGPGVAVADLDLASQQDARSTLPASPTGGRRSTGRTRSSSRSDRQRISSLDLGGAAVTGRVRAGEFTFHGLRISYEEYGSGPQILVYLHGLVARRQPQPTSRVALAQAGNRVVLVDLPGHGHSDKPRHASVHRMDSYADFVVALLDHLDMQTAVIGGVSLGANVALQCAVKAPDRTQGLLLEMPVLEWAVPGAGIVFLPLLLGVHYAARVFRFLGDIVRSVPKTRELDLRGIAGTTDAPTRGGRRRASRTIRRADRPDGRATPVDQGACARDRASRWTSSTRSATPRTSSRNCLTVGWFRQRRSSSSGSDPSALSGEIAGFLDEAWALSEASQASGSAVSFATLRGSLPRTTSSRVMCSRTFRRLARHCDPDILETLGGTLVDGRLGSQPPHLCERPVERTHHIGEGDRVGGPGEPVAALCSPLAGHDARRDGGRSGCCPGTSTEGSATRRASPPWRARPPLPPGRAGHASHSRPLPECARADSAA